jgi:uncharacterized protein (TIGR03437 family)
MTLTATVSPSAATGKVTIFDGVTIVGIGTLSGGQAAVTTATLPSGVRMLTAYYAGDSVYSASTSRPLRETVVPITAKAYQISASYPVGQGPRCVAIGDFNGDGKMDLAVANDKSNTLSVLLGSGNGGFTPAGTYNVGYQSWFVATGDFNGDGKLDLVVLATLDDPQNAQAGQLNVLLGNGDGTFQAPLNIGTGFFPRPTQLGVADFNSDGIADFAVVANGTGNVDLLFGRGDATFQNFTPYGLYRAAFLTVGDFNGDGKADLAISNSDDGNIYIYLGHGDGTLQLLPAHYPVGSDTGFLAAGDFNGDGKLDLVMAGQGTGKIYVLLGNGDGTFQQSVSYAVGQMPSSVAIADLNADGIPDLVVSNSNGYSLSILYGKGDGSFQPAVAFGSNIGSYNPDFWIPMFVAVGDFNGDGIADLAVADYGWNEVTIVLGVATLAPDLTVAKTHTGTFSQGQKGATYTITVSNIGLAATSAQVAVVDTLPTGLTAAAISGTGWSCELAVLTCARSDGLAVKAAYPPVTVTVNVAANAPASVTNTATVSGGGEFNAGNDSASDVTAIHQSNAPVLSAGGIVNASFNSGALPASPGSLISIFGSNLGASPVGASADSGGHLPLTLGGASVRIGSSSAPLLYAGPTQINAQVPFELSPGTYAVVVTTAAGPSNSINLTITAASPGVFAGAVVSNATGAAINAQNPFRPGDVIVVYCTGLGAVSPKGLTGQLAPSSPISFATATPTVTIGGLPVQVANAVLSPGFVGLYQIGIVVPGGLPPGAQPLIVTSGGVTASPLLVVSAPSLDAQYCADISGTWSVTQSGTVTEVAVSAIENDDITDPYHTQGTINIVQTGCSVSYTPTPIPGLVTQSQAAAMARSGTVVGNTVSLQGLLTTPSLAVTTPGLTITQVSQNAYHSAGRVTGAVISTSDSGSFAGSGTYSVNGQTGSFTLAYTLTGTATLVRPGVGPIPQGSMIVTVAGNGLAGETGDGGPATAAMVAGPFGVATDASGNLFIASGGQIRKVSPDGIITTYAGNGQRTFSGDGGPAISAGVYPEGLAVDASGNLFIADFANNRIRKVSASGTITTVAGNGTEGFSGDGGPATSAKLASPQGVAVDASGSLFIADSGRIRKVSADGIITTVAGKGTGGYSGDGGPATSASVDPTSVAVDASGNLFIADTGNNRIRKVSASGIITTVAGNGPSSPVGGYSGDGGVATSASLNFPLGVAVDASGNLFIADYSNQRVRKVSPSGIITTVAGNGTAAFSGDGGLAASASLSYPQGVAVDAAGNLYIADYDNDRVREVLAPAFFAAGSSSLQSNPAGNAGFPSRIHTFAAFLPVAPRE